MSNKSRLIATLLAFFLGPLGIHNFYLGKKGAAITQLVLTILLITSPISAIWAFVDFVIIVCGAGKDGDGQSVSDWQVK